MNTIQFESSQYVPVEFALATPTQRLIAWAIDFVLFAIYMICGATFWYFLSESVDREMREFYTLLGLFVARLPWLFYHPFCEFFFDGQTLGKYVMGIKVIRLDGERLSLKEVVVRWIFKGDFVWIGHSPLLIVLWFVMGFLALFTIGWSTYGQRLADRLANTLVIAIRNQHPYRLDDILKLSDGQNYTVKYPQVLQFTEDDMLLVKNTLVRLNEYPNKELKKFTEQLSVKIATYMEIGEIRIPYKDFLQQVLRDYIVLTR